MKIVTNARVRGLLASASLCAMIATGAVSAQADQKFVSPSNIIHNSYDGTSNDLLTAGLGKTGLGSAVPPGFVDALNPTAEELRRLARIVSRIDHECEPFLVGLGLVFL